MFVYIYIYIYVDLSTVATSLQIVRSRIGHVLSGSRYE